MISVGILKTEKVPDNKVHEANMGPTWVLSAPDGPLVVRMNLAIWGMFPLSRQHENKHQYKQECIEIRTTE